jgi:hypothetical protein
MLLSIALGGSGREQFARYGSRLARYSPLNSQSYRLRRNFHRILDAVDLMRDDNTGNDERPVARIFREANPNSLKTQCG